MLNCARVLTRLVAALFEDSAWDGFWLTATPVGVVITMVWLRNTHIESLPQPPESTLVLLPANQSKEPFLSSGAPPDQPLAHTLLNAIIVRTRHNTSNSRTQDLLFCPEFTCNKPKVARHVSVSAHNMCAAEDVPAPRRVSAGCHAADTAERRGGVLLVCIRPELGMLWRGAGTRGSGTTATSR